MDWGVQGDKNQQVNTKDESMFPAHGDREDSFLEMREGYRRWLDDQTKQVVSLSASLVKIKDRLTALGMEVVFEVATATRLVNLFSLPDALSLTDIWSHEQQLGQACKYDRQNLYYSRVYLENSIDIQLQQRIISVVNSDDGGPTFWHIMQRSLSSAATAKLIKAQR